MKSRPIPTCLGLLALAVPCALAQRVPLTGDARFVRLHDVGELIRSWGMTPPPTADAAEEYRRHQLESIAAFARTFVQPPLDGEEDIRRLGRNHVVSLARPEQQAWLGDLFRRQLEAGEHMIDLEVRLLSVPDAQYRGLVGPVLDRVAARREEPPDDPVGDFFQAGGEARTLAILPKADAEALLAGVPGAPGVMLVHAPRLLSRPMQLAEMGMTRKIRYVRDFEIVQEAGVPRAVPVHDEVTDGLQMSMSCGLVGPGLLGLSLRVEISEVEQPITRFTTTVEGIEVTMDLPNVRTRTLDQRVVLPDGGTGLFAVRDDSGMHTVFLATTTIQR